MIYCDKIHGVIRVAHPVFSDIIASQTFQRLQHIQMGAWRPYHPFYAMSVSRYDHSIGVFMLLAKHGASIEEQIGGLIHDVSHTAFSHLSDRLFGDAESIKTSAFQDNVHEKFVKNSELADIITRHGFSLDDVLDERAHVLKERDLPDLCADRIDYGLRAIPHMQNYGHLLDIDVVALADTFVPTKNGFVMRDKQSAQQFARAFNETDAAIYASYAGVFSEELLAQICRDAIKRGILTRDDFFNLTDMQIIRKMYAAGISFQSLNKNPDDYRAAQTDTNYTILPQKVRRIDPPFIDTDGQVKRLSATDEKFAAKFAQFKRFAEYRIKSL